jgi:hypothetical protein
MLTDGLWDSAAGFRIREQSRPKLMVSLLFLSPVSTEIARVCSSVRAFLLISHLM